MTIRPPQHFNSSADSGSDLIAILEQGRNEEAERLARSILASNPADAAAANVRGLALLGLGSHQEASVIFTDLTRRHPEDALLWNNLGTAWQRLGRMQDAEQAFEKALRIEPADPRYLANLGFLQLEAGRQQKAKQLLLAAVRGDPANLEVRIHCAQTCLDCGEPTLAEELLTDWRRWVGQLDARLQVDLASVLLRLGEDAASIDLLEANLNDTPSGHSARARLVGVLERINRLDDARTQLSALPAPEQVDDPQLRGEIIEAHAALLARGPDPDSARDMLEQLLSYQGSKDERLRVATQFMLAKLCDQQDDVAACMKYLELAHAAQMQFVSQVMPELASPNANSLSIADFPLSAEQFQGWNRLDEPSMEDSPVFVVGFPRSGTTMLEQMLDAHPAMVSMDERPFVQRVIEHMQSMGLQYPEQLGLLDAEQCERLRATYWGAVANVARLRPGQRLVDKNPLTMLRLPMLVRLFPNSKIIFVMRHPCDVLLSCYLQNFSAPPFMALCSSLQRLAAGYIKAMQFWIRHVELMKPQVFEWRYESVVEDFSANVERLGDFLELGDTAPLRAFSEHAKRKGFITTPSYSQVVQPVYKSSIGRWRRYREYFEPILPLLQPAMDHWNYPPEAVLPASSS